MEFVNGDEGIKGNGSSLSEGIYTPFFESRDVPLKGNSVKSCIRAVITSPPIDPSDRCYVSHVLNDGRLKPVGSIEKLDGGRRPTAANLRCRMDI